MTLRYILIFVIFDLRKPEFRSGVWPSADYCNLRFYHYVPADSPDKIPTQYTRWIFNEIDQFFFYSLLGGK